MASLHSFTHENRDATGTAQSFNAVMSEASALGVDIMGIANPPLPLTLERGERVQNYSHPLQVNGEEVANSFFIRQYYIFENGNTEVTAYFS
jgi:hypothetical protein